MASFAFKALELGGARTGGEVDGEDRQAVAQQLRAKGLIVLEIEEKKASADFGELTARFKKVKSYDLTVATRQLSTMISSGMSMLRALHVLEEQSSNPKLRDALVQVRKDVESGVSLSDSLARHPDIFNDLYRAMISAGETGGILDETLKRVADQLEKDESLKRQVKSAMMYPSVIGGFALIVLLALVAFLVPVFEGIFKDFGGELPAITKFTVFLSDLVTQRWYIGLAGTLLAVFAFRRWKRSERGRMQWDRFKLGIPWKIGDIVQKVALARFSRTFSAMIAAGVPILEAIDITGRTSGNRVVEKAMGAVRDSVKSGGTIAAPMREERAAFPNMVVQMIGVGEETGALDSMMSKIADFYEDEVAASVKALTSIIEPLMIVVVGAIVGFIVIAMYLPMFSVYDQIR
ncbi:MAG: type II secretion system F family protein [Thermoleophilaceae bacterium]|nr:type II secretion system F family protein [Thermoleophilaceae bacterium]